MTADRDYTIRQVGQILGLKHGQVWKYVVTGRLPAHRAADNHTWLITEQDVVRFTRSPVGVGSRKRAVPLTPEEIDRVRQLRAAVTPDGEVA